MTGGRDRRSSSRDGEQYALALTCDGANSVNRQAGARPPGRVPDLPPEFFLSANPHLADLIHPGEAHAVAGPYDKHIAAGKNTYVYDAHTYHTKVPPEGIGLLIDYYTRPGDVVLDPFCGSGMTGVAALERGRKAILCDLSPAAAFIAYNMCTPVDYRSYLDAVYEILREASALERDLYTTRCRTCGQDTLMLYMVWSYGVLCPSCGKEFVLWDVARAEGPTVRESKIRSEFACPYCGVQLRKRGLTRTQRYPVQVGYKCCSGRRQEATAPPDAHDLALLHDISGPPQGLWYPTDPFPDGVNTRQAIAAGITSVDKAYTPRALAAMAFLWDAALRWPEERLRLKLLFTITSLYQRVTLFSEFRFWGGSGNMANYNVPAIINEQNVFQVFLRKARTISWYFKHAPHVHRELRVSTQSACSLPQLPDGSVDYIFTDPPFGGNINYSEMNLLWESWLRVRTDTTEEAIVNRVQGKGIPEYRGLLRRAFSEMRRVLKDGAYLTVVFHNSSAQVWHALQEAIVDAGFSIATTQTFDKRHGTFKQFVSSNAVGYDLVLHCRKAERRVLLQANGKAASLENAASFVRRALSQQPTKYVLRYLHVRREDETDYRKLYAEWLAAGISKTLVNISFDEFREVAARIVRELGVGR